MPKAAMTASQSASTSADLPLVSVIVPTFNRIEFLREALQSAIGQTHRNLEIIVSDDGTNDLVLTQIVEPLADPRIVYRRNPTTLGMGLNIWTAFRSAKGKYVATLHDDDRWEPEFLARLVPPLEAEPAFVVAFSDHHVVDEHGKFDHALADRNMRAWNRHVLPAGRVEDFVRVAVVDGAVPAAMAALFRRELIDWDDFPAEVGTYYDVWLNYLAARTGRPGYYCPERLTRYRVHGGSETRSWTQLSGRLRALRQSEFLFRRYLADPALGSIAAYSASKYRHSVVSLTLALFEAGEPEEAKRLLARAGTVAPSPIYAVLAAGARLPARLLRDGSALARRAQAFARRVR
jgi:glycosyltransferase involved in cell wall biosynthesis